MPAEWQPKLKSTALDSAGSEDSDLLDQDLVV